MIFEASQCVIAGIVVVIVVVVVVIDIVVVVVVIRSFEFPSCRLECSVTIGPVKDQIFTFSQ